MAHKYGAQRSMSQREITGFWEHSGSRVIKYWGMSLKAKIQMVPLLDVLFLLFSRHFHFSHFIGKCLHTQMLFFCTSGCEIYKMGGESTCSYFTFLFCFSLDTHISSRYVTHIIVWVHIHQTLNNLTIPCIYLIYLALLTFLLLLSLHFLCIWLYVCLFHCTWGIANLQIYYTFYNDKKRF